MPQTERYQLQELIGQSATANVYKAFDPRTRRHIAIKILRDEYVVNDEVLQGFLAEAKIIGKLAHPNIVSVYDVGERDKRPYIAMELLSGQFLSKIVDEGDQLPWNSVVEIALQLASALKYAHDHGVVHGDLRPANIAWSVDTNKVVITDFSVARLDNICDDETLEAYKGPGIPKYMAPEQVLGNDAEIRSDLFAVGVILYQLLTGQKPFTANTLAELTEQYTNIQTKAQPVSQYRPDLHNSLVRILEKLLETNPQGRFQNSSELIHALQACSDQAGHGHIVDKDASKSKKAIYVVGFFGLAILSGALWHLLTRSPSIETPPVSETGQGEVVDESTAELKKSAELLALETHIVQRLNNFECANLQVGVSEQQGVTISGYVSVEEDMMSIMDIMDSIPDVDNVAYEMTTMRWPFCEIAAIISEHKHPNIISRSALRIGADLKGGLNDGKLTMEIDTPTYDSYVYADIYTASGSVIHLTPENHDKQSVVPASGQMYLSDKANLLDMEDENLLVVMAAKSPLVIPKRVQKEVAQDYLQLLHKQIVVNKVKLSAKMLIITPTTN